MIAAIIATLGFAAFSIALGIASVVHGSDSERLNWNRFGPGVLLLWTGLLLIAATVKLGILG